MGKEETETKSQDVDDEAFIMEVVWARHRAAEEEKFGEDQKIAAKTDGTVGWQMFSLGSWLSHAYE